MKLYNYFRSSASFRVRIALALKGLPYEYVPVHIAKGEHKQAAWADVLAEGLVPALELDDGTRLTQSMAIIEYLDETQPGVIEVYESSAEDGSKLFPVRIEVILEA